jgi:triosephosphate isomerase (TIM)
MTRDKKLIVANWKMNLNTHEASLYLHKLAGLVQVHRDVEVVIAPSLLFLQSLSLQVNRKQFKLAVQNLYWRDHGAFTGEVSATQLHGVVDYAIIGHSERRHIFNESDKDTRAKVQAAIRNKIKPILCIGETALERTDGETQHVLHDQLVGGLANVTSEDLSEVTIAYEPVWAIGTGDNALPADVEKSADTIRNHIKHLYGAKAAKNINILYGGSVTADSAGDYLAINGIDGLLVGGASLDAHGFNEIVKKAHRKAVK